MALKKTYDDAAFPIEAEIKGGPSAMTVTKATFTVYWQKGGAGDPEEKNPTTPENPATGFPKKAVCTYGPVAVPDDVDYYVLTYKVAVQPTGKSVTTSDGEHTIEVWAKNVELTFTSDDNQAHKSCTFDIMQGGKKQRTYTAGADGKWTGSLPFGAWSVVVNAPWEFDGAVPPAGRKRTFKVKKRAVVARFITPNPQDPTAAIKQYVNLTTEMTWSRDKPNGPEVWFQVATVDDVGKKDQHIHIECVFGRENKRNKPLPALMPDGLDGVVVSTDGGKNQRGKIKLDAELKARFKIHLGLAGLDTCTVKIGCTAPGGGAWAGDTNLKFENWRKLFYQMTLPQGAAVTPTARLEAAFAEGGIEMEKYDPLVPNSKPPTRVAVLLSPVPGDATMAKVRYTDPSTNQQKDLDGPGVSWFPTTWFNSARPLLNVGTNNGKFFHETFFMNDHRPRGIHLLLVDRQFDYAEMDFTDVEVDSASTVPWSDASNPVGKELTATGKVFPVSLKTSGSPLISGKWVEVVPPREQRLFELLDAGPQLLDDIKKQFTGTNAWGTIEADLGTLVTRNELTREDLPNGGIKYTSLKPLFCKGMRKGDLDAADIYVPLPIAKKAQIKLPAAAATVVNSGAGKKVKITVKLGMANGPYLGESDGKRGYLILIVLTQTDNQINDTVTHEVGHTMSQAAYYTEDLPPGFVDGDHGREYIKNGHQGPHCAEGMTALNYAGGQGKAASNYRKKFGGKAECTCVMYGEDNNACTGKYCARCLPFVKGVDVTNFMKDLWWKED